MFLFIQETKSHKQPAPNLAFAEHQLLDPGSGQSRKKSSPGLPQPGRWEHASVPRPCPGEVPGVPGTGVLPAHDQPEGSQPGLAGPWGLF